MYLMAKTGALDTKSKKGTEKIEMFRPSVDVRTVALNNKLQLQECIS